MFPLLYSQNEPVHFLGFFTSWIRVRNTGFLTVRVVAKAVLRSRDDLEGILSSGGGGGG